MRVFFAALLLVAGCATQKPVEPVDVPDEIFVIDETIIVPEDTRLCENGYVEVCRKYFVGEDDCHCVRRFIFDRGIVVRR